MLTVAYLANQFPASVEPYVGEEILELRRRGVRVIPGSARQSDSATGQFSSDEVLCLQPVRAMALLRALGLFVRRWNRISRLVARILLRGKEPPKVRVKALLHTCLGAYYAILLQGCGVNHIHVHHGYFGSWIGMVAARLLGVSFSLTLHGSDLLLHGTYLDTKLANCLFCVTISDFNRRYILEHFPEIDPAKIFVSRLGVDVPLTAHLAPRAEPGRQRKFTLLAVGRLHAVKGHAFLVHACARLRDSGANFECLVAGEGPERHALELLIRQNRLQGRVTLLGHVAREDIDPLYRTADVIVLTSRSEGIPLVLMEAMARGRIVLAPAITGIPELVIPGKTGFLYQPGHLEDFVQRILFLQILMRDTGHKPRNRVDWIRRAACVYVRNNFSRETNLTKFGYLFHRLAAPRDWSVVHENSVLQ